MYFINIKTILQEVFEKLREKLTKTFIVQYFNFSNSFFLFTDASIIRFSIILVQKKIIKNI